MVECFDVVEAFCGASAPTSKVNAAQKADAAERAKKVAAAKKRGS